jgi:hypothetical protein
MFCRNRKEWFGKDDIDDFSSFLSLFVLSVFLFNLLGLLLGFAMQSNSEVHLTGSLGIFLIIFFSGFIPVPLRLRGFIHALSAWSPAAQLVKRMLSLIRGESMIQPTTSLFLFGCLVLVVILWLSRTFNWRH